MDLLNKGRGYVNLKLHDKMVQHSIYAGIVFLIVAHPKTFQLVDSVIKVHDKNALLFVHAQKYINYRNTSVPLQRAHERREGHFYHEP